MEFPRWLDPRRIYQDPKRLLNPLGVRGGLLYGAAADIVADKLNLPDPVRGAMYGALAAPNPVLMPVGALIGADMYNPVNAGEDEMLRKAREEDRKLLERGIQPGQAPTATLSETPRRRSETDVDVIPPRVARETGPAIVNTPVPVSSPVPALATGGNPMNEVDAVERNAVSAFDRAMAQMGPVGGYESIKSDRLRDALRGAQEDILRKRFG